MPVLYFVPENSNICSVSNSNCIHVASADSYSWWLVSSKIQ